MTAKRNGAPALATLQRCLLDWATEAGVYTAVHDRREDFRVTLDSAIVVTFCDTLPQVVVEWGDGYRGDFSHGLPCRALVGLVAGFLGKETLG